MKLLCWNCGASLDDVPRPISRHATCDKCFNELHCCRLCKYYDPKRSMQCFEDRADPPLQKENANFCDFFAPSAKAFETQTVHRSDAAKTQLSALFGSADETTEEDETTVEEPSSPADAPQSPASKEQIAAQKLKDLFKS